MADGSPAQSPHNDLRVIEARLRASRWIGDDDTVWDALDRLWNFVVLGAGKETLRGSV